MFFSGSILQSQYRNQLLVTVTVSIITYSHGINMGWIAPTLEKLRSEEESPLDFALDVHEASWVGSSQYIGNVTGCILFTIILFNFGTKITMYLLAIPHILMWVLIYFAKSVIYLCIGRCLGGMSGAAIMGIIPIFLSDVVDSAIRGRIMSIFAIIYTGGITTGYILGSYLDYHLVPLIVLVLPILYLLCLCTISPESPQYLLRTGHEYEAESSLRFYCNYKGNTKEEIAAFANKFSDLKLAILAQISAARASPLTLSDLLQKNMLKALGTVVVLSALNTFSGFLAFISYTSSIFAAVQTQLSTNVNTISIGGIQMLGVITSIYAVDSLGRKKLIITSTVATILSVAAFGVYAFFSNNTDYDLSAVSAWLPLLLVGAAIYSICTGIVPVTLALMIEAMPLKVRSVAVMLCIGMIAIFGFVTLRIFLELFETIGVPATMWGAAGICAACLVYIIIVLEETKGKSLERD